MPMKPDMILSLLARAFPGAGVDLQDTAGDNDHYNLVVTCEAFRGKSRVEQHRMVYAALEGRMGGELHALAVQTRIPDNIHSDQQG